MNMAIDPFQLIEAVLTTAVAVLATFQTLRALLPAKWISIDGKPVIWPALSLLTTLAVWGQLHPADAAGWVLFAIQDGGTVGVVLALDAGVASVETLRSALRSVVTLGGRTNTP